MRFKQSILILAIILFLFPIVSFAESDEIFTNSIDMKFVLIPKGTFLMGSPSNEPKRESDERQHRVTISQPFYLQTTEVTVGQWRSFINDTGYRTKAEIQGWSMIWTGSKWVKKKGYYWDNPEFPQTETHPVTCLSWNDVQKFIEWLTGKEGKTYRLPTETEWEYACRAGTTTPFYTGNCISTDQANYDGTHPMPGCPEGEYRKGPVEVESFEPNPWGLHDMHGNVWEWCQDKYKRDYPSGRVTDPKGPTSGWERVLRGGSWHNYAGHIRSALRYRYYPDKWLNYSGFRLAQDY